MQGPWSWVLFPLSLGATIVTFAICILVVAWLSFARATYYFKAYTTQRIHESCCCFYDWIPNLLVDFEALLQPHYKCYIFFFLQMCQVMNNNVMKCPTPPLVDSLKNIIRSKRAEQTDRKLSPVKIVQLGFIMDGVLAVRNLSAVPNLDHGLKYYPNPRVYNFTESSGIKILKGESLIIEVNSTVNNNSCNERVSWQNKPNSIVFVFR